MKALILNSGMGSRLLPLTKDKPKCMTQLRENETILSLQLKSLSLSGIKDIVITTGYEADKLIKYGSELGRQLGISVRFVFNDLFNSTNYIYSVYLAEKYLHDNLLLLHGDLVFDPTILQGLLRAGGSRMVVSSTAALPEKDFKAQIIGDRITSIGTDIFESAMAAQPLYKLDLDDWIIWLKEIVKFCEDGNRNCYAENAFNIISETCNLLPYDIMGLLCMEIDNLTDYNYIKYVLNK